MRHRLILKSFLSVFIAIFMWPVTVFAHNETEPKFDTKQLACAIAKGMASNNWIADLNRIHKQVQAVTKDIEDPKSDPENDDFTFRIPFLKHFIYWFFSSKEFTYIFAYHNPKLITVNYDINIWQKLTRDQMNREKRPERPLITEAGLLQRLRAEALKEPDLYSFGVYQNGENKTENEQYNAIWGSYAKMGSVFIDWLLQQEQNSVSQKVLFEKALQLAGDSYGALGLIAGTFFIDANAYPRQQHAVLSSKIQSISELGMQDHAGTIYHFWNYLARAVAQPQERLHLRLMSLGYERINQGDMIDYEADQLGMRIAGLVDRAVREKKFCVSSIKN